MNLAQCRWPCLAIWLGGVLLGGTALAAPDSEHDAAAAAAIARGEQIYRLDKAAWVSTDTMRQRLPPDRLRQVRGWVVEPLGDGQLRAVYFGRAADGHRFLLYSADVRDAVVTGDHVPGADVDERLSPIGEAMANALAAAPTDGLRCTDAPFNSVVIPPTDVNQPIAVYLLSAQTSNDTIPFGGHHLAVIARDGHVVSRRSFTKACLNIPVISEKGQVESLVVTHSLDPVPTELHVFSSLAARLPVFVMIGKRGWWVEGARITGDQPNSGRSAKSKPKG